MDPRSGGYQREIGIVGPLDRYSVGTGAALGWFSGALIAARGGPNVGTAPEGGPMYLTRAVFAFPDGVDVELVPRRPEWSTANRLMVARAAAECSGLTATVPSRRVLIRRTPWSSERSSSWSACCSSGPFLGPGVHRLGVGVW